MVKVLVPRHDRRVPLATIMMGAPSNTAEGRERRASSGAATRSVRVILDGVRRAPTILAAIRLAPEVRRAAGAAALTEGSDTALLDVILEAVHDEADTVTAIAAIHALARIPGTQAEEELRRLLAASEPAFASHAAWALHGRPFSRALLAPLAETIAGARLAGLHAQRVLAHWGRQDGSAVLGSLQAALRDTDMPAARRYLAETIGLVPGGAARDLLERLAADAAEAEEVRVEAIAAFADRPHDAIPASIARLASRGGSLAVALRTARVRRALRRRGVRRHDRTDGLAIAQVHLAAVIDPQASSAGVGDNGGVATLLSRLGAALSDEHGIGETLTIGRAPVGAAWPGPVVRSRSGPAHRFDGVPLQTGEGVTFSAGWPALVAAERGIRAALLAARTPDVIHLRMADPGSLAGATVARELGIATVFTMAPDPHGPIAAAERIGRMDRRTFAAQDAEAALWFRATLVEQLARSSREVVVFPRPDLRRQLWELVGIDIGAAAPRHTVVSEGVDTHQLDAAARAIAAGREASAVTDLRDAIEGSPASRQGLPIVISVGRLHQLKGMARLVEAFANDAELADRANLVIVGGNLEDPSTAEAAELARIQDQFDRHPGLEERVVLLGHRPNGEVSQLLAVARLGWGTAIGPHGAYVCGSLKEEFGLAIVEAMAAGLPVVAPLAGGPATYVEDGVTGRLVETSTPSAIAIGVKDCLELARDAETAVRARRVVDERYTLAQMARTLAGVYRAAAGRQEHLRTPARPLAAGRAA